ncbi:hypothetical protein ACXWRW_11865, partial [Streptococcus pyogenes]
FLSCSPFPPAPSPFLSLFSPSPLFSSSPFLSSSFPPLPSSLFLLSLLPPPFLSLPPPSPLFPSLSFSFSPPFLFPSP